VQGRAPPRAALLDAGRRAGVLVCGLFCRLRGKGRACVAKHGMGGKNRGVKRDLDALVELRGAERRVQISRELDAVCVFDGGWSHDWAFGQGVVAPNYNPVPYWSWRPLCPGE